jgi:hypothetical protein
MLRGTLVTGACRRYSWAVKRVRLHQELKVLHGEDKAETPRRQSYVDQVGLEWLACPLSIVKLMQRRDCIEEGIVLRLRLPFT